MRTVKPRVIEVGRDEVAALLRGPNVPSAADRDEMAVPTYLHANPLARWIFWKRHHTILELAEVRPADAILDFGTGIGALLPSLCALAPTVVWASDLHDQLARRLAERCLPYCCRECRRMRHQRPHLYQGGETRGLAARYNQGRSD